MKLHKYYFPLTLTLLAFNGSSLPMDNRILTPGELNAVLALCGAVDMPKALPVIQFRFVDTPQVLPMPRFRPIAPRPAPLALLPLAHKQVSGQPIDTQKAKPKEQPLLHPLQVKRQQKKVENRIPNTFKFTLKSAIKKP